MKNTPNIGDDLDAFLGAHAPADLAHVLGALAKAALPLAYRIRRGPLAEGVANHGVALMALDIVAEEAFASGLKGAGVRALLSEKSGDAAALDADGALLVAINPLDASDNIDANISLGAIFSVLDAPAGEWRSDHYLQPGVKQRAAGALIYGTHVALVLTTGAGVHVATLDPDSNRFRISRVDVRVPQGVSEFAIDSANARHWPKPVRAYIDDCLEGAEGPRGRNFNMRWVGSAAADVYRILVRGGVALHPEDSREGCAQGHLSLVTEANPIAFLIEQAGGAAIDGFDRILETAPTSIAMRTPLIFGSKDKVDRIARYYSEGSVSVDSSPLFGTRGLLRR